MLTAAVLLLAAQAKLPTYEQVLKNMHNALTHVKGYREVWTVKEDDPEGTNMKCVRSLDGERGRMQVFDGDKLVIDTVADGKKTIMVAHGAKVYGEAETAKAIKDEPFKMPSTDAMEDGTFSLVMDQVYSPAVVFKPAPKVRSLENVTVDGKPARLLTMSLEVKEKPGQIKMWFQPDKWILTRLEIIGKEHQTTFASKIEENITFGPTDFTIDPKSYEGYTKVAIG